MRIDKSNSSRPTISIKNNTILENDSENILQGNNALALEILQKQGKPLLGYFTNRVPVEILHALNTIPVRIVSQGLDQTTKGASEQYIQAFGCSWLRHILDIGLSNGFDGLDGFIFSAGTCDSLQNFSDIFRKVFPKKWTHNLTFPVLDNEYAVDYLQNEFENLIQAVSIQFPENESGFNLSHSISLYNAKRTYFQKLAILVSDRKLAYKELAKILYLGDLLPVESINSYLEAKINDIEKGNLSQSPLPESPRLIVTGGMFDNFHLWELPEFDYLVADDLSFGRRNFNFMIPLGSFVEGYTQAYLERTPDATAFDMEKRLGNLKKLIHDYKVDGVILLGIKFCDPDAFEFVPIQNVLKNELNIPYLKLETTSELSNLQQLKTRLSAFIEMLS
ncbi:MAG: 2-hydroxyacyl-CoA dehydratase subunit D [Candidatus Hodarchaeota archaeon]